MRKLLVVLTAVLPWSMVFACELPKPPVTPTVDVVVEDVDWLEGSDPNSREFPMCEIACANLRRLGCPESKTLDGGLSCYEVCAKAERSGRFTLRPQCIAGAGDRAALLDCKTVRCEAQK